MAPDPVESAAEAGLRYVTDSGPCIRRVRCGKSFRYAGVDGKPLRDPQHLARIRSLVIPPAWRDVWICPTPKGHLQAVGWDARGRKQYRYHPDYRKVRDETKFNRMAAFGAVLPRVRELVERDLRRSGLSREKVLATVVRLLDLTYVRIGNDQYAKENKSFGLTTMRNRHVTIDGAKLVFRFRGKSGQEHTIELSDRRLANIVKRCQELPGHELFEYVNDDGSVSRVSSDDVNRYLRQLAGDDFTAKDFRTWAGTVLATRELRTAAAPASETEGRKAVVAAITQVSAKLGNRPATCRKYYVHTAITDAYINGSLFAGRRAGPLNLQPEERAVMALLNVQDEPARARTA